MKDYLKTDKYIRQCVTPGDHIIYEGSKYIASANKIEKHKLYAHNLLTQRCIKNGMIDVCVDKNNLPVNAGKW